MNFLSRRSLDEPTALSRGGEVRGMDAGDMSAPELSPKSVLAAGWRHKWLIVGCVVASLVGAIVYLKHATPLYTGFAQIFVKKQAPRVMNNVDGVSAVLGSDETYVFTQISLISSTPVISDAVAHLDTKHMVTFADDVNPTAFIKSQLSVDVGRRDGILTLSLDAPSPEEATAIVAAVVDAYRHYQASQEMSSAAEILGILQRETTDRTAELKTKRAEMLAFRKAHGELSFQTNDKGNIVYQRLSRLSDELTNAQVEALNARVDLNASNNIAQARKAAELAQQRVGELQKAYNEQQKLALELNSDDAEFDTLTADVARLERLLDTLNSRMNEVNLSDATAGANILVVEAASAAPNPTKPETLKILGMAVAGGLLLGSLLVTIRELTDERLRSTDGIVSALGMPVLGMIPEMQGSQSPSLRGRKVQLEFMSDVAEAYRTLRTSIYFGTRNEPIKTLLITRPGQGEGKSTTAGNLAIAIAQAGRRTLIIDTDFRRPQLHRIFEIKDEIGLSSVLAGRETLDKAIHPTGLKGLEILPCGPIPSNPSEILNSDAFAKLLMNLAGRYDMIVLDSPPVSPVTDARILGAICDATLLVLKSDRTKRGNAMLAADALHSVGARLLGVVCNGVTRKSGGDRYYTGYGHGYTRSAQARLVGDSEPRRLPMGQLME
jgi:capsular exopolysaccharide synthesis family protein